MIKISTIIPVYNAEKYIARCLDSILNQPMDELEIICVDDGSTDSSLEILRDYEQRFANVHVLTQKNQYAGVARNNGLKIAQGEYVHFVDADDYLYDNVYPKIYEFAKSLDADFVKARASIFDESTGKDVFSYFTISLLGVDKNIFGKIISIDDCPNELITTNVALWSGIIRRQFVIENSIYSSDLRCMNDRSFYYSLIIKSTKISFIDLYLVHYQTNNLQSLGGAKGNYFDNVLKSYNLLKQITKYCSDDIKKKILIHNFGDTVKAFSCLINDAQKTKFKSDIVDFFVNFDWSDISIKSKLNKNEIKKLLSTNNDIVESVNVLLFQNEIMPLNKNLSELPDTLKNYKMVYLYGAGKNSKIILPWLKNKGIVPTGILVSSLTGNPTEIQDIKVMLYDSKQILNDKSNTAIFISTDSTNVLYIYKNLKKLNYKNIFYIKDGDYKSIELNSDKVK